MLLTVAIATIVVTVLFVTWRYLCRRRAEQRLEARMEQQLDGHGCGPELSVIDPEDTLVDHATVQVNDEQHRHVTLRPRLIGLVALMCLGVLVGSVAMWQSADGENESAPPGSAPDPATPITNDPVPTTTVTTSPTTSPPAPTSEPEPRPASTPTPRQPTSDRQPTPSPPPEPEPTVEPTKEPAEETEETEPTEEPNDDDEENQAAREDDSGDGERTSGHGRGALVELPSHVGGIIVGLVR